ncbi:MAG: biotin--[acetyl-CoA-carboxylase] ligase [Candidatus Competibacterales bacterium]
MSDDDNQRIRRALENSVAVSLTIEVADSLPSTNAHLLEVARRGAPRGWVILAHAQTQGRGRQGRPWHSPPGSNLYLSLLWRPPPGATWQPGLTLAVGVAVAEALASLQVPDLALKWPNDLLARRRKLGGILVEGGGGSGVDAFAVIGIGINRALPDDLPIDQPWTDLSRLMDQPPSWTNLAAGVLNALVPTLEAFDEVGLTAVATRWRRFDAAAGRGVTVASPGGPVAGIARGIADDGALLVETPQGLRRFVAGDVRLRIAP